MEASEHKLAEQHAIREEEEKLDKQRQEMQERASKLNQRRVDSSL